MTEVDALLARSVTEAPLAIAPDEIAIEAGHEPDQVTVAALKESIARVGLIHPIVVWERAVGDWLLVAGRNRYEALRQLGATVIPCEVLKERPSDLVRIDENLARRHLTPEQQAELRRIRNKLVADRKGKSTRAIAEETGLTQNMVSQVKGGSQVEPVLGRDGKTYSSREAVSERRGRMLVLLRAGKSYAQVAAELGTTVSTVANDAATMKKQGVDVPNTRTLAKTDPATAHLAALRAAWSAACPEARAKFREEIASE